MDQERIESEKTDEVMLPGFRFHPTDEELVGFYLTRKIQQKPLSIELIKQLDIYKYDPWDLPKLATTGEKEWYFYCPRDRKYRNSTRPNRVTGAGFWKATGTDRPIYSSSSQGSKCIGLKKSLVFYKGRAAKGIKTDWMMHEFRLPSLSDSLSPKKYFDKIIPANEAWAICRIFKKASSSTQRALSQSWVSPSLDQTTKSDTINPATITNFNFSTSTNMAMSNKITNTPLHFGFSNDIQQSSIASTFSPLHFPLINHMENTQSSNAVQLNSHYKIPTVESSEPPPKSAINDASSLLLEMSNSMFGEFMKGSDNEGFSTCNGFSTENMQENLYHVEETVVVTDQNVEEFDDQWGVIRSFPYGFPMSLSDAWKSNLVWDYSSPCPSKLSTSYSTNNCYT